MSQPRFAALRADMGRESANVRRLVAEAQEWADKLSGYPDTVRVAREAASSTTFTAAWKGFFA